MKMLRKLLSCSICAFLCIGFNLSRAQSGTVPELSAALCEMACWESPEKAVQDSLLMRKAAFLSEAGDPSGAYRTLCRIRSFGLDSTRRAEILRLKLIAAYDAGMMEDFTALLGEMPDAVAPSGKLRRKNEDLAMILSVLPGAGLAYSGDWPAAGKYFLLHSAALALGAGCFVSGLYVAAFAGGGMLLYGIIPRSTSAAVNAASERNSAFMKDYFNPLTSIMKNNPEK